MKTLHRALRTIGPLALVGCASANGPGAGFDIDFPDNRPAQIGSIAATVQSHPATPGPALVVLTAPPPARGMTVFSLPDGQRLWQSGARIDARPAPVGEVVVSHEGSQVIGWDARSGHERFRLDDHGFALIGAGGDEHFVALSLGPGGLNRRRGWFGIVDAQSGRVLYTRDVEQSLGIPTIAGGYAFVPWNAQYLSIVDIGRGAEQARLRSTDDLFGIALHEGGGVYYGSRNLYRLSEAGAHGTRANAPVYALPRQDLPGNPTLLPAGYEAHAAGANARERVAVVSRPDPAASGTAMLDDTIYSVFYRVIFALDAHTGAVRWAHTLGGGDVVGTQAVRGGLVFVDERGEAAMLDVAHGNTVWHASLGANAAQGVFQLPIDFSPPHAGEEPVQPAAETLLAAAGNTDDRLLPARIFATNALAITQGPEATRGLLDIASRRNYPPPLRAAAGEALAHRTDGMDALIEALGRHYDYVQQTDEPPVGFIARALANAHERRGVPGLIAHLADPFTPASDLPPLVAALKDLGDPSAVPALLDFVRLYHADDGPTPQVGQGDPINDRQLPEQEAMNSALEQAVDAVAQLGGPRDRRWLTWLQGDVNTLEPLRGALTRAVGAAATTTASDTGGTSASGNTGNAQGAADATVAGVLPEHVTRAMIEASFGPQRDAMMHCLDNAPSRPSQVRIEFRFDNAGVVSNVAVVPATLGPCITPMAMRVHLPESQTPRDIGSWYLLGDSP